MLPRFSRTRSLPSQTILLVILSVIAMGLVVEPSLAHAVGPLPTSITLDNGYSIRFLGVTYHEDGTSTWRYVVRELPQAQDLSNWVLELPPCVRLVDATPEPWELVDLDPNTHLSGIKWQTGAGFRAGRFEFRVHGHWPVGVTHVAAKGPDVAHGVIAGLACAPCDGTEDATDDEPPTLAIPAGHHPPPGHCRLWYPGRPAGQQPSPVRCAQLVPRRGTFIVYKGRAWAADFDWHGYAQRHPGEVPAVILRMIPPR